MTAIGSVRNGFLSVEIAPTAARQVLDEKADVFASLLEELGPDRELAPGWKVPGGPFSCAGAAALSEAAPQVADARLPQ